MRLDQKGSPTSESSTLNIAIDEKQKENCAPNQFFSSLLVQSKVAAFTRVCSYDRSGAAWSDLGPKPRTMDQEAFDLHPFLLPLENADPMWLLVSRSEAWSFESSLKNIEAKPRPLYWWTHIAKIHNSLQTERCSECAWLLRIARFQPLGQVWELRTG
jgi:hypothetical protein